MSHSEYVFDASRYQSMPKVRQGLALLARTRVVGRISMFFFLLAVLFLADGLQALMRHEFNTIDMLPGETDMVSGMAPAKVNSVQELKYTLEGLPGISFRPTEIFKGFWMGGQMWRAELSIAENVSPGEAVLTVEDVVPARRKGAPPLTKEQKKSGDLENDPDTVFVQNPRLIYTLRVFATEAERTAAQPSFFIRFFHISSFFLAAAIAVLALIIGLVNWKIFSKAEELLTGAGVYFIHGIKRLDSGNRAAFAHAGHKDFALGERFTLLDAQWNEQGYGEITEKNNAKGFAMVYPEGIVPKYAWIFVRPPQQINSDISSSTGQDR